MSGCACKVNRQISEIEKRYGTKVMSAKKTHIADDIKLFFKKMGLYIICLPFVPIIVLYILIRKCFTEKPISIDKFIRKQK